MQLRRNYSAHHARMFNRVYALKPRLPKIGAYPELDAVAPVMNRLFGQLTIVQYLLVKLNIGDPALLPSVIASYQFLSHYHRAISVFQKTGSRTRSGVSTNPSGKSRIRTRLHQSVNLQPIGVARS